MNQLKNFFSSFIQGSNARCQNEAQNTPPPSHIEEDDMNFMTEESIFENMQRRPPPFEALLHPVNMITGKSEFTKGFKIEFGVPLSETFLTSHSWSLPFSKKEDNFADGGMPSMPMFKEPRQSQYQISTQLVNLNKKTNKPTLILVGRSSSLGSLETNIIKPLSHGFTFKHETNFRNSDFNQSMSAYEISKESRDSIHSFKYSSQYWGFNMVQSLWTGAQFGFDYSYFTARDTSELSYGGKWTTKNKNHTLYGQYMATMKKFSLAYHLKFNPALQLAAEFQSNTHNGETVTTVGYKQRFQNCELLSTINSKGKLASTVKFIGPIYMLKLCASIDYPKNKTKFGFGISLGQVN